MSLINDIEIKGLENFQKIKNYLMISDLILLLLKIENIEGNTKMQKEVFLTWKEIFNDVTLPLPYLPYKYGAFSKVLNDVIKILEQEKFLEKRKKGKTIEFSITNKGRKKINEKMKSIKIDERNLRERMQDWNEWKSDGLKRYVYRKYPIYTTESLVPYLKW